MAYLSPSPRLVARILVAVVELDGDGVGSFLDNATKIEPPSSVHIVDVADGDVVDTMVVSRAH